MKKTNHFIVVCASLFVFFFRETAVSQMVTDRFDKLDLSENFDSSSGMWTFVANNDNLFLVQDGEYILNRKSTVSPFAVMANYDYPAPTYRMVTSIKLEKSVDDNGSIGIIFMAQEDGKGGFLFEINKLNQYRLRQISGGSYKYLTGDAKNSGWTRTALLNELNVYNLLEIKTSNRNYDISLNNQFLMSFSEIAYKSGRFGVIIGPGSKGKVDFLYLFSSSKYAADGTSFTDANAQAANTTNQNVAKENSPDIIALAESIIKLKTQINKLQADNDDLKKTIDAIRSDDTETENQKKNYDKEIKQMQSQTARQTASFDSLLRINKELFKYKEMVAGNENSDLIITLSKNIKAEKERNKVLSDSLSHVKSELQKLRVNKKPGTNGAATGNVPAKPDSAKQKTNEPFELPKEN